MRIFYFNKDNQSDPLTLLYNSGQRAELHTPSRSLNFPPEIVQRILTFLPRTSLPNVACVNRLWNALAMPILYRHIYIRTLPHWLSLVNAFSQPGFSAQYGPYVNSVVLLPSPQLVSSQLTSALNHRVIENDDLLQPSLRGYVRLERVNFELTGLEMMEKPMQEHEEDGHHENFAEIDTTQKEAEWLSMVTDDQMCQLLRDCSQLEYLHLSGCERLSDEIIITLARAKTLPHSRPMRGLWLSLLRNLTPHGITEMMRVEKELGLPKRLKHLDLGFQVLLTDEAIESIVAYWGSSLTHIRLNSIYHLNNYAIYAISKYCPHLILLHLVRCWRMDNAALYRLAHQCKKLRYVSVSFLSQSNEEGIKHLIHSCPDLVWLDITGSGINSLFKTVILDSWANYRKQHHLPPVYIKDGTMNLL
ncbi:hypothetical protein EDC96DRAFT_496754 [Choanephora cucurbitarum]|nr:hypothetical protein EDC96DRAFT_496754 [Choanephora cucurbitarum]